jgi:hypothetical protein
MQKHHHTLQVRPTLDNTKPASRFIILIKFIFIILISIYLCNTILLIVDGEQNQIENKEKGKAGKSF